MNKLIGLFLKGLAMGSANVIPGVSGGTIALITGIYERLIHAIKRCDVTAIRLLLSGQVQSLWRHVDGTFLTAVGAGVVASIFSLAKLLEFLLTQHETYTMGFFFGLILLSLWYVAKSVRRWSAGALLLLLLGAVIATGIAHLAPATENDSFAYLFACGVVAISSMILPGLSGSFVLIIMGNYALILGAIASLNLAVLLPVLVGCVFGLIAFSHFLAWVFARYHDLTIALMSGFILGSLVIIWPWKATLTAMVARDNKPDKEVVTGYDWYLPLLSDTSTILTIALMVAGAVVIWLIEHFGNRPDRIEKHS